MMAAFTIGLLLVAAGLVLVLTPSLDPQNRLARKLGAGLVAVLMLRYLYWRVTASMPPFDLTLSGIASWFLLVVELLNCCAGMLLLHVLSGVLPVSRSVEADAHPVESHPGGPPLIDMLIPTYNESAQILRRTILGARDQDYPRFRVWVCDDLRRPWLRDLA